MAKNQFKVEQTTPDLFPRLVQYIDGNFYDGNGNLIEVVSGSQGPQGPTGIGGGGTGSGSQGPTGPQGVQGFQGPTGSPGSGNYVISATAPYIPTSGDRWYDLTSGLEYVWIDDGTSTQWVTPGAIGPQGTTGPQGIGATGFQGPIGPQGDQGVQGPTGPAVQYAITGTSSATIVTGTTSNILSQSLLVPANSRAAGQVVQIVFATIKSTLTSTHQPRLYWNTSATLSGATLLASNGAHAANVQSSYTIRDISIEVADGSGNGSVIFSTLEFANNPYVAITALTSNVNINWRTTGYFIVAIQNASVLDSSVCVYIAIK